MLYMVIERFVDGDPVPVYRRFREQGRMAPDGLHYISSWVDDQLACCFQIMETAQPELLQRWMANWSDIVQFEVHPVLTSAEAAARVARRRPDAD